MRSLNEVSFIADFLCDAARGTCAAIAATEPFAVRSAAPAMVVIGMRTTYGGAEFCLRMMH